jgi:hypothetical protein
MTEVPENGHVARMGEVKKVFKVLVGKPEGKQQLRKPRCRWEDGIRMDLGRGWSGCIWLRRAVLDSKSSSFQVNMVLCHKNVA